MRTVNTAGAVFREELLNQLFYSAPSDPHIRLRLWCLLDRRSPWPDDLVLAPIAGGSAHRV